MQGYRVDKIMVEQSSTVPKSIHKEYLNQTLGLTLSTPGLVGLLDYMIVILATKTSSTYVLV